MTVTRDTLDRTAKLEIDTGAADSVDDALARLHTYVLQVVIGARALTTPAGRAAILTAINTGRRAFLGGVLVVLDSDVNDSVVDWPLHGRRTTSSVVALLKGTVTDTTDDEHPAIVIDDSEHAARGSVTLHTTWSGWCAGVVTDPAQRLDQDGSVAVAGVAAAALAVSEAFQHVRGLVVAGRRDVGISLWDPTIDWTSPDGHGPDLTVAPDRWWLLGLGHLGQAYAWTIGMLPYADPGDVTIWLQDTDTIVGANVSTSLLADDSAIGSLKTRVVASRLEAAGLGTRIIERLFDEHTVPKDSEAVVALAGFDSPQPRRAIDNFEIAIDGGIGAGPHDYLDTVVHTFPAAVPPTDAFPAAAPRVLDPSAPAYTKLIDDAVAAGAAPGDARCGVLDIAGASIGAAFVGAFTAAIAVSAALRVLVDGPYFEVVSVSLRDPAYVDVATGTTPAGFNPGFTALSYCA